MWEPDLLPVEASVELCRTMVVAAQAANSSHRADTAAMIGRSQVLVPPPPAAAAALSLAIHSIVAVTWKIVNDRQWRLLSNASAGQNGRRKHTRSGEGQLPANEEDHSNIMILYPAACVPPVRALYCALCHMSDPNVAANAYGKFSQRFADLASVLYCASLSRNAKSVGPLTTPVWKAMRAVAAVSGKLDTAEIAKHASLAISNKIPMAQRDRSAERIHLPALCERPLVANLDDISTHCVSWSLVFVSTFLRAA